MTICGYDFGTGKISPHYLEPRSGVYAIICKEKGKFYVIDVGESHDVQTRVLTHDRKSCWESNCHGILQYYAHYTPNKQQHGRMIIEQEIRAEYNLPCGQR